jgi:hypothetical protein
MAKEETPLDKDFLEFVVKSIVNNPDDVEVTRKVDEMGVLLNLKVNSEDMGQIIGRQGSTAKAIRTLLRVIGLKNHARINLKIEEPEGGRQSSSDRSQESNTSETTQENNKDVDEVVDELKL